MTSRPDPREWLEEALENDPFPWQERLLDDLLSQRIPRALDLPTGLGKTAVMAIWLVARASGARWLPRRLVYVVDRRAVVDQATHVAEALRRWARRPDVSANLGLANGDLPISTLRGQFVDNREWLEDPAAPAIVVGTVDMIGSRLLFEGYACSRKMRPYHAGLLGTDTLFVLDEAHLVPPFERLLEAATTNADLGRGGPTERVPAARMLSLSATGRDHGARAFRLDARDREHDVVRQRLLATKRITVEALPPKQKLVDVLAARAWSLATASEEPLRIIVFTHKRDDAMRARDALLARARADRGKKADTPEAELFVGGRRIRDRSRAERQLRTLGFLAGAERPVDHAFLFATSAGEVGVDLDADHMVADVVAWERMVQRLGRVNRRGERDADVVLVADPESPWSGPVRELVSLLPRIGDASDGSPLALGDLAGDHPDRVRAASTPEPLYPALTRPLLDAWAMTSLREHTGRPEVQPWLRGWLEHDPPQTTVIWRRHLPPVGDHPSDPRVVAFFEAAPPHTSERLDAETHHVAAWLTCRAARVGGSAEATVAPDAVVAWALDAAGEPASALTLQALDRLDDANGRRQLGRQLAGRVLVVDSRLGGLDGQGLLDVACDDVPVTADDGTDWLDPLPDGEPPVPFRIVVRAPEERFDDANWRVRLRLPLETSADEEVVRLLVIEKWRHTGATEDDRSSGPPQLLDEHQRETAAHADAIARALGLSDAHRQALVIAARLHDEGKRAARWQRAFRAPPGGVYAKTAGPVNVRLLDGYRHELGSLVHARSDEELRTLPRDLQDLVLHLIAAHHGFARPVIRTSGFDDLPPSAVEALAQEVALRFVRMQDRWGPWGLAWWETLLRAADQQASRANAEREGR